MIILHLKDIIKKSEGNFLSFYNLVYDNKDGSEKIYEMVCPSKDLSMNNKELLSESNPRSVVIIPLSEDREKVVLNKEYRLVVNTLTYNTVAGFIEKGESIEEAARREIKEETGLDLVEIIDILPPCFSAVGLTNEKNVCIFCTVKGEIDSSNAGVDEEIESVWVTKQEFSNLLKQGVPMAARTQMFGYLWINKI